VDLVLGARPSCVCVHTHAFVRAKEKDMRWGVRVLVRVQVDLVCRVDVGTPVQQQPRDLELAFVRCVLEARISTLRNKVERCEADERCGFRLPGTEGIQANSSKRKSEWVGVTGCL
jgi:hypothetical protein